MMMLRSALPASRLVRYTALGLGGGGTAALAVSSIAPSSLSSSDKTTTTTTTGSSWRGLQREARFWTQVAPIVMDYWWHASSSSPLVMYQKRQQQQQNPTTTTYFNDATDDVDEDANQKTPSRSEVFNQLHDRNAPKIYNVMVELGGLYVKLGQVLSVTALPVPNQYRDLFRTLQSNVPGHEEFDTVIKPTLEAELGKPLEEVFEMIEEIPVGSASIGQAHRARLKATPDDDDDEGSAPSSSITSRDVIVKVQYPNAKWQVPADIDCVGDFLRLCVYFGVVDESSASLSFDEFSRQFMSELEYKNEAQNLQETYESSLDPKAPYLKRGVVIPKTFPELCTDQIITMSYLPGPKFEEQARRQLESLGIDTQGGMRAVFEESEASEAAIVTKDSSSFESSSSPPRTKSLLHIGATSSWATRMSEYIGKTVGVDTIFYLVRVVRQVYLRLTAATVRSIQTASNLSLVPKTWSEWAKQHENAAYQAEMLAWTEDAIDSLFDCHGYQIFEQGLFNADAHPGNILVLQPPDDGPESTRRFHRPKLGLIDYGQCKRLNPDERARVAKLIVSVADDASDEVIAANLRAMGIKTKNDSTEFLAKFAKLMFGPFCPEVRAFRR